MGSKFHRVRIASRGITLRSLSALVVVATLFVLAGTGCSPGESEDAGMTPEGFCRRSAEVTCSSLAACCSSSEADCVLKYEAGCLESTYNAINRGMVFQKDAAERCVTQVDGSYEGCVVPTSDGSERNGPCGLVFKGSVGPGFACTFDGACAGEAGLSGVCLNDVCARVPSLSAGAPCGARENGVCPADSYCHTTCQRVKAAGKGCVSGAECASGRCESQLCAAIPLADVCEALTEGG